MENSEKNRVLVLEFLSAHDLPKGYTSSLLQAFEDNCPHGITDIVQSWIKKEGSEVNKTHDQICDSIEDLWASLD